MTTLGVWMNGRHVGAWQQVRGGRDRFTYDKAWAMDSQSRALSLSLPLTADRVITDIAVRNYFDNLLPDNQSIRNRLQARFSTRTSETFDLLEAIGRDCVGAVQLLPQDEEPRDWDRIAVTALKPKEIEAILRAAPTAAAPLLNGMNEDEDFRISLAGAQEKTALTRIGRTWYRPTGSTPTTHILKLPLGLVGGRNLDLSHSVDNEWLCAALLKELGLPVASTSIGRFGDQRVLVVERFDRRWQRIADHDSQAADFQPPRNAWIARVPQEDFCQATGKPYQQKYETDGGPGIRTILDTLARAVQPHRDQSVFLQTQLAFWMLAATDGHAKNFSIFHLRGGGFESTPLYDVLSTWPVIGKRTDQLAFNKLKLAMALRTTSAHYRMAEVQPRHFDALAKAYPVAEAWPAMIALAQRVEGAIAKVGKHLPTDFAEVVWKTMVAGLQAQADTFLQYARG